MIRRSLARVERVGVRLRSCILIRFGEGLGAERGLLGRINRDGKARGRRSEREHREEGEDDHVVGGAASMLLAVR